MLSRDRELFICDACEILAAGIAARITFYEQRAVNAGERF